MEPASSKKHGARIIDVLAKNPLSSARVLRRETSRTGKACTLQAVYKELSKLQKEGTVVKVKDEFTLSWSWLANIGSFVEETRNRYLACDRLFVPQKDGDRFEWRFNDLRTVDDFWGHLLLSLAVETKERLIFEWIPHPWFELIHEEKEDAFRRAMIQQRCRLYMCVGGDSYLDRVHESRWDRRMYTYSFAESPFQHRRSEYFDVIGDHILTLSLPRTFSSRMDQIYETSRKTDLNIPRLLSLLTEKVVIKATVERNHAKSARLRRVFAGFFGA